MADEVAAGAAATDSATLEAGGATAGDDDPPVIGDAVPVPFCAIAICLNIACVLFAVGLMEKVIPFPQWPFCLQ